MTSDTGLLALLHRSNQIGEKQFVESLGRSKVTARQYQVLALVAENKGASQTKIVGMSGIDRSTLADIVKRLVEGKLIARRRVKSDSACL